MDVLVPLYLKEFKCIGSSCKDTCCKGWGVSLDKNTYKKYKKSNSAKLKTLFETKIKREKKSRNNEYSYGKIIMGEQKICPFLNEKNLCNIYIECGEDYLSNTCKYYPRSFSKIYDFIEIGLTTSCPEVARLALSNKNKMEFEMTDMYVDKNAKIDHSFDSYNNAQRKLFWSLRNFCIDLMQNRNYKLDERLSILGISMSNLSDMIKNKDYDNIENRLIAYNSMIDNMEFKKNFDNMYLRKDMQLKVLKQLSELRAEEGDKRKYSEYFKISLKTLNYGEDYKQNLKNYLNAYENYYKKFMQENTYILENYIVNNMFFTKFPYSSTKSMNLFENFMFLIIKYFIIKFNLVCLSKYYGDEFDANKAIEIIQGISKFVDHSDSFIQGTINLLKLKNLTTPAHMMIFIKD